MANRRRLATLIAALTLATGSLTAPALGQSAGDDQYADPFGDDPGQSQGSGNPDPDTSTSSDDQGTQSAQTQVPAAPATTAATAAEVSAAAPQLPRTGSDAGLLALGGVLLLAGGVALRVRVR